MILLLNYSRCPVKGQKQTRTPRGRPTQRAPARWRHGSCHRLDHGCRGQSKHDNQSGSTSVPSPARLQQHKASPLGTGSHGDVVVLSPGNRASQASLWAGLDQGLRGSLCPWYKSATTASRPRPRRVPRPHRPAGPGGARPRLCAEPGSGGTAPHGSCPAAGPRQ